MTEEEFEKEQRRKQEWSAALGLRRDIERAARHMKIEWPEVVDSWSDMASEIVVHLVQKNYATVVLGLDPKPRRNTLTKIGQQIASSMRDDYEHFNGNFKYSTNEVRQFLEGGALDGILEYTVDNYGNQADNWFPRDSKDGAGREVFGKQNKIEPFDIRFTFPQLGENHRKILVRRFLYLEELDGTARKEVTRAVDALTDLMNRAYRKTSAEFDGPGAKRHRTNAEALNESRSNE